jgi:eukaryotic translation initiation factor 2C
MSRQPFPRRVHESELANPQDDEARLQAENRHKALVLTDYHPRPGSGVAGSSINVLANFYQVRFAGGTGKLIQHYDVDITPIVRMTDGKKPPKDDRPPRKLPLLLMKQILAAYGETLGPENAASFLDGAFDGRKNFFTPTPLPALAGSKEPLKGEVMLPFEDPRPPRPGQEDQPQGRRFKIAIQHANVIDLEAIAKFCRAERQSTQVENAMLTAIMSVNVLLRQEVSPLRASMSPFRAHQFLFQPSLRYTPVGAAQNRFFDMQQTGMFLQCHTQQ